MYGERPLFRSRPRLQINNETDGLFDHVTNLDLDGRGMGSSAHRNLKERKMTKTIIMRIKLKKYILIYTISILFLFKNGSSQKSTSNNEKYILESHTPKVCDSIDRG